jgi:hypothetical protein
MQIDSALNAAGHEVGFLEFKDAVHRA